MFNDRVKEIELVAEMLGGEDTFTSTHPIFIASNGINLTVVSRPSQWLSTIPTWEGVGRET
jgi:hypothetical protein